MQLVGHGLSHHRPPEKTKIARKSIRIPPKVVVDHDLPVQQRVLHLVIKIKVIVMQRILLREHLSAPVKINAKEGNPLLQGQRTKMVKIIWKMKIQNKVHLDP